MANKIKMTHPKYKKKKNKKKNIMVVHGIVDALSSGVRCCR